MNWFRKSIIAGNDMEFGAILVPAHKKTALICGFLSYSREYGRQYNHACWCHTRVFTCFYCLSLSEITGVFRKFGAIYGATKKGPSSRSRRVFYFF